ncbi:hypothetical protein [Tepidibacter thalassicus]|uniref:Uncharacterized protein n=1 Tax=Tepidibacter thalassicus DSM 15285 TaxID=1123350 RepID=A0A1M5TXW9_9FIRM|nr:hypothetical protein [Tepidibacter thalassicus]SHH55534.1 hypothetical protein SAMN02744040_02334 [Tepidibacter thalassicus DSM 15285]
MDRKEFDNLDTLEQVEYFNKKLKENLSISKICKNIGIARTTVTDRFKRAGFKFDKNKKCYKSITNELPQKSDKSNTFVTPSERTENNGNIISQENNLNQIVDIINLKNDILELVSLKQEIKNTIEAVKKYEFKNNVIDIPELKIDFSKMTGQIKNRSFKVYEDILKKFLKFAKENKKFKQQDLLSQAMLEFIERYDK